MAAMINDDFIFSVIARGRLPAAANSKAFLIRDNWDDWFEFETLFSLVVFDAAGKQHDIGGVKIGQIGMRKDQRRPELQGKFDHLEEPFFSLGQDDSYYEGLNTLGEEMRDHILASLNDVAADLALFDRVLEERVTATSLLRSVTPTTVRGQFHRLARGGARLSRYVFSYTAPKRVGTGQPPLTLSFEVKPASDPPTNIHVLIGRNGVGKTYLLNHMTRALVDDPTSSKQVGSFSSEEAPDNAGLFANLVSVSFSAFDDFEPLPEQTDRNATTRYSYVGLKRSSNIGKDKDTPKSPEMLASEFVKSVRTCLKGARGPRWRAALEVLETDPIFKEAGITDLVDDSTEENFKKRASSLFRRLSSGHKIVLLIITRLVETVEERTLVLVDEPEAHLHPPLLSAFVRTLSDLLIDRNGVAIIATHSPVVLQEVPKNCAWKLRRTGLEVSVARPEIETFGENVGVLTREAFGLEVTHSGFHRVLQKAVEGNASFEAVLHRFSDELGAEARAIVRALIAARDSEHNT